MSMESSGTSTQSWFPRLLKKAKTAERLCRRSQGFGSPTPRASERPREAVLLRAAPEMPSSGLKVKHKNQHKRRSQPQK